MINFLTIYFNMSSSFRLCKRKGECNVWSFGDQSDHYIREWGDCHPDFVAVPIGHPDGIKVCIRKGSPYATKVGTKVGEIGDEARNFGVTNLTPSANCCGEKVRYPGVIAGDIRYERSANLYAPRPSYDDRLNDAYPDFLRRLPYENYNVNHNYFRDEVFNGLGIPYTSNQFGINYRKIPCVNYRVPDNYE